jgi:hypothetical protein
MNYTTGYHRTPRGTAGAALGGLRNLREQEGLMFTEDQIVDALRATLDLRETADAMTAQADTQEAAIDTAITERGYDAEESMHRAYFIRGSGS